jgi:hypothetical protein
MHPHGVLNVPAKASCSTLDAPNVQFISFFILSGSCIYLEAGACDSNRQEAFLSNHKPTRRQDESTLRHFAEKYGER